MDIGTRTRIERNPRFAACRAACHEFSAACTSCSSAVLMDGGGAHVSERASGRCDMNPHQLARSETCAPSAVSEATHRNLCLALDFDSSLHTIAPAILPGSRKCL